MANCYLCGTELHQRLIDNRKERSFSTCIRGERICEFCESAIERRQLPKRRIGIFAAEWKGKPIPRRERDEEKRLAAAVRLGKPFESGQFSFRPA